MGPLIEFTFSRSLLQLIQLVERIQWTQGVDIQSTNVCNDRILREKSGS